MVWFGRRNGKKVQVPPNLWIKCPNCNQILYNKAVENNLRVCTECDYHFRMTAPERIALLMDEGSFLEYDKDMESKDILNFRDRRRYRDRIAEAQQQTGLKSAIITGEGDIEGHQVVTGVMDFRFIGGSMGSVVGEKVTRVVERAGEKEVPLIIVSTSGGARMQESVFSLMQMVKTSAALARFEDTRLPFISVLADPTTGGVSASFSMLGDIIIAEKNALIGFTGPRVIEQTIGQKLPEGFQRAEFQIEHGMVDMVVDRRDLKDTISKILNLLAN